MFEVSNWYEESILSHKTLPDESMQVNERHTKGNASQWEATTIRSFTSRAKSCTSYKGKVVLLSGTKKRLTPKAVSNFATTILLTGSESLVRVAAA